MSVEHGHEALLEQGLLSLLRSLFPSEQPARTVTTHIQDGEVILVVRFLSFVSDTQLAHLPQSYAGISIRYEVPMDYSREEEYA